MPEEQGFKKSDIILVAVFLITLVILLTVVGFGYMKVNEEKAEACEDAEMGNSWNGDNCYSLNGTITTPEAVEKVNNWERAIDVFMVILGIILVMLALIIAIKLVYRFGKEVLRM